jgi:hypothetical protein
MPEIIIAPGIDFNIVSDGVPTLEFYTWIDQVTNAVNAVPPLTGTGTPESNVIASAGRWYVDTNASPADIYYKETGDGDTGWTITS